MKYTYLVLFLISTLFIEGCVSKKAAPTPKKVKTIRHLDLAKINYPKKVGTYELSHKEKLKSDALGIMIRYVDHRKTKAYLDCYIYPQKVNKSIEEEYKDTILALSFMHQKGELKKFEKIYEDTIMIDNNHQAKRTVFDMENKSVPFYSVLYLAPYEDHFFKVRISNPHKSEFLESDYGEKAVKELYRMIKFNN
jgi:hypothetical protein